VSNGNDWVGIIGTAVGTILGAVIGPLSIYLFRRWNRPKLTASIEPGSGSLIECPIIDAQDIIAFQERKKTDPSAKLGFSSKAKYEPPQEWWTPR
jgi:hypothetical protein